MYHLSEALSNDIYTEVIIMVAASTIITPIWLKLSYKDEALEPTASTITASGPSRLIHRNKSILGLSYVKISLRL